MGSRYVRTGNDLVPFLDHVQDFNVEVREHGRKVDKQVHSGLLATPLLGGRFIPIICQDCAEQLWVMQAESLVPDGGSRSIV